MTGRTNLADAQEAFEQKTVMMLHALNSGKARTAPTRACGDCGGDTINVF